MASTKTTAEAAEAFTQSYATAMHLGAPSASTPLETVAAALAAHYGVNMASYTSGYIHNFENVPYSTAAIASHLKRFEAAGLGFDIYLKSHRIEVVSDSPVGSALCWITWAIRPKKGEGWEWENVYGFRRNDGEERGGHWEFVVSDNEIGHLMQRVPDFMTIEI